MTSIDKSLQQPVIGREYPAPNEEAVIAEVIQLTKSDLERLYTNSRTLRQVHSKMHGCVKAEFIVEENLSPELRVGIFKEAKCFPAWVRYSNGFTLIRHDKKKDTRGVAIKLMNVHGDKLLDNEKDACTQDLVLASSPFFFAKDLPGFIGLLRATISKNKVKVPLFFLTHWKIAYRTIFKILVKCKHPLETPYFSGTPYRFGDEKRAVKYLLRPSPGNQLVYTNQKDFDYLHNNLVATLDKYDTYFDFCIQFQTDPVKTPIEDATVEWHSPFIKVATLKIPAQKFNTPERELFGDNLTYNIWHSLPEHRPLGSFNRGRKFIYEALYRFRTERNCVNLPEPTADPDFLHPENLGKNGRSQ